MKIGPLELVIVFIVALIVIGPNKLPEYAKKFGEAMREFKKASSVLTSEIKENIVEPLEEAQRPLREAMEPITELDKEIRGNIKEVTDSVNNIGKVKKERPEKETNVAESEPAETEAVVKTATEDANEEAATDDTGEEPATDEGVEVAAEAVQVNTEAVDVEAVEEKEDTDEKA